MKIQFWGGAQSVTGSQHLLEVNGKKILLECGLYQGRRKETYELNKNFGFDPSELDAMLLSHAHIDHSGNIPNLVANGFVGPIYTTSTTVDLCQFMLRDSAFLQEKDIEWVNKRKEKKGEPLIEPLYTMEDVEVALKQFIGLQYNHSYEVVPGVKVTFLDAGHIIGSSSILLEIEEDGKKFRFGFTGDIGRKNMPIIRDPNQLRDLDVLIMESTYGNRLHDASPDVAERFSSIINKVVDRGGKIIVPAFAVGRTQLLVYELHKLFDQNRIPNIPIYVDSPMACNATDVFRMHPECYDREMHRIFMQEHEDPFGFGRLKYVRKADDSKKLAELDGPFMIISASGMAEGGRILHHLRNYMGDPKNLVLFVGYAAQHTLARRIMDGNEIVKIFGEEHKVKCDIEKIDDFSAHADRDEMLDYLEFVKPERLEHLFLVHGEDEQALPFKATLESKGYRNVHYPARGDEFTI